MSNSDPFNFLGDSGMFGAPDAVDLDSMITEVVLDRVRLRLGTQVSQSVLRDLNFSRRNRAEVLGDGLSYQLEGWICGKEVRVNTIDRKVDTVTHPATVEESVVVDSEAYYPLTWWDHIKETFAAWVRRKYMSGPEDDHALYNRVWDRLHDWTGCWRIPRATVPTATSFITTKTVHNTTKHITVEKHWHMCPHINIPSGISDRSTRMHIAFLTDTAVEAS